MPLSPGEVERRIERNTNDIESIYELLSEHSTQLRAIEQKLTAHDARFDSHDARFDAHDARFDRIDETLVEVLRRLPEPPTA